MHDFDNFLANILCANLFKLEDLLVLFCKKKFHLCSSKALFNTVEFLVSLQGPLYGFPDSMSTNCGFKVFQRMGSQCHVVLSVQHYQARAERGLLMNKEDTST